MKKITLLMLFLGCLFLAGQVLAKCNVKNCTCAHSLATLNLKTGGQALPTLVKGDKDCTIVEIAIPADVVGFQDKVVCYKSDNTGIYSETNEPGSTILCTKPLDKKCPTCHHLLKLHSMRKDACEEK